MKSSLHLCRRYIYWIIYLPLLLIMSLWHFPLFSGRRNIPKGAVLLCGNHTGLADPIWLVLAMRQREIPWIMAKKSLLQIPLFGRFLSWFGVFGVDREHADLTAVKKSLSVLKNGDNLLIFPEGTRRHEGVKLVPKSGALLLASRTNVPIIPVYISRRRFPFQPVRCIIGQPYHPDFSCARPEAQELQEKAEELMVKIYQLGEKT